MASQRKKNIPHKIESILRASQGIFYDKNSLFDCTRFRFQHSTLVVSAAESPVNLISNVDKRAVPDLVLLCLNIFFFPPDCR